MAKRKTPRKMPYKHNFPIRRTHPISGTITMENQPHKVFVPTEIVTLLLTEHAVKRSKELHGRGNSQTCSGSLCVYQQRDCFTHPVTGVTDFLYSRVFIQSDDKKKECYGYMHSAPWFPKLNDQKGGHDKLLAKLKENKGPLSIVLRPIEYQPPAPHGNRTGTRPRRSARKRGTHLRAAVGTYGFDTAYKEPK